MRSQEGEGKSAPDGAGCGGRRRPPHLWLGSSGEGHGGQRREWGSGAWGTCVTKCTLPSPAPAFLGKGELGIAIVVIPYLRCPSWTWCFVVGPATTEGSPALGNVLHRVHGGPVMFPSWQCRGRAALCQTPEWCSRVCTAMCEAVGNFTCRCRSLIMTQDLKIWNTKNGPFPLWGCGIAEPDVK